MNSLLIITKNSDAMLEQCIKSAQDLVNEIVIIDDQYPSNDLGKKRMFGLKKCKGEWILVLDTDEIVSQKLQQEIKQVLINPKFDGYLIPYQNHLFNKPLKYGGEKYKVLRLFRKDKVYIKANLIHEKFEMKTNNIGVLKNKIQHYSYRNLWQMFLKFTDYGIRQAKQKAKEKEKTSLKKIFLYPIHMFWARFVKDKGYKDGLFRLALDIGFAYMEFLTYLLLLI